MIRNNFTWHSVTRRRVYIQIIRSAHSRLSIEIGGNDNWEVGLCEISYSPNTVGTLKSLDVVGATTALVYCDVISPQYVGKSLIRCLRTFMYPTMYGEHVKDNIYYLPVEKHTIKNIRIETLQLTGKWNEFKNSKTLTKVVLHFRRFTAW